MESFCLCDHSMIERLGMNSKIGSERSPYIQIHRQLRQTAASCKIETPSSLFVTQLTFCRAYLLSSSFTTCSALELEPFCSDSTAWTMIFACVVTVNGQMLLLLAETQENPDLLSQWFGSPNVTMDLFQFQVVFLVDDWKAPVVLFQAS